MIYPNFDVGPGFREARKHGTLALPTLGQTGTQVIRRIDRAWFYVFLHQHRRTATWGSHNLPFQRPAAIHSSFRESFGLWIVTQTEKQLLGLLRLEVLYVQAVPKIKIQNKQLQSCGVQALRLLNFSFWRYI